MEPHGARRLVVCDRRLAAISRARALAAAGGAGARWRRGDCGLAVRMQSRGPRGRGAAKIAKYGLCEIGQGRPQNPKHPNNPTHPFRRDVDEVEFESLRRCAHEKFSVTPWGKCPNSFIYYSKIQHHV